MKNKLSFKISKQRGFSKIGLIATLLVLIVGLTCGLKILPIYIDHNFVQGIAKSLIDSGRVETLTQTEVRQEIAASLRLNNIYNFDLSSITATRGNGTAAITIQYERRVPLFSNLDVVASFDDRIE